jgi:formamidopyrimidine-DNA glycosylase
MPELPEVETIVRDLQEIVGSKILFNRMLMDKCFKTPFYKLNGLHIESIERYGKYIIMRFTNTALLVHLGMSGKMFIDYDNVVVPKHTHFLFQLDNGKQIRFVDHRRFGNVWHMTYDQCREYVEIKLGPEPWDIDAESFHLRLQQYRGRPIKAVLLEQKLIAGVGNIYASEACYAAFIHPETLVEQLDEKKTEHLLYAIRKVLEQGIKNRGTTFGDYRDGKGNKGTNQNALGVFKQHNKLCRRCGDIITKSKVEDRTTYYCYGCQK